MCLPLGPGRLGQGRAELEEEGCRLPGGRAVCACVSFVGVYVPVRFVCVSLPAAVLLPQQPFLLHSALFLLLLIPHCRLLFLMRLN